MRGGHDVVIHASVSAVAHKHVDDLGDDEEAFWRVNGEPRRTEPGRHIWFETDGRIHGWGMITGVEDGRIWFDGLRKDDLPCPVSVPTRGFKYVDPLVPEFSDYEIEGSER